MPDFSNPELMQCQDCDHHFQISPRGEIQGGACPDCGGKRLFRMQPNPVQSEGTLRNMVDMETGKDAGGNPDGEGILAPPGGHAILTAFIGDELECPTCHMRTSDIQCPRCGTFIDPTGISSEQSGGPAELRPQIPGAPLTEGTIMDADHTDPYDTGAHGRDEYSHSHVISVVAEPMQSLRCPQCKSEIMTDPQTGDAYCTHCNQSWPIHRDDPLDERAIDTRELAYGLDRPPTVVMPGDWGPAHQGRIADFDPLPRTAGEMEDILGLEPQQPKSNLNWTPGKKGRGIVIGGEPHTWNTDDPNKILESSQIGRPSHAEYIESLGVDPKHIDWNTGIEIEPNGHTLAQGGHNVAPFIAADPRLKHIGERFFPFGNPMPITSRTNNMEPYESLWSREADVEFDQGPLQNVPSDAEPEPTQTYANPLDEWAPRKTQSPAKPAYSVVVQPSDVGLHGAHTGRRSLLSFLDAHVNGTPVRGNSGELITKYGFRKAPDFGKPMVVAVHDPAHLPAAVESIQHPNGKSSLINDLVPKIRSGEVPAPPGINPKTLEPDPRFGWDEAKHPIEARTASLWSTLGEAALPVAGLALAPETGGASLALDAGEAGALLGGESAGAAGAGVATEGAGAAAEGASGTAGGLMSKAMSGAGGLAKAEGISSLVGQGVGMGEKALGMGGGGETGGGGGYSGPLQQFTHVLAAFVESDYETPASNPDVGVKHDDPEDVDQKEFNDQDKNPSNPMNPNLQDSGASGEDEVRKDMGKPAQGQFSEHSPSIQRMEMLMPLIEKYYHSDESGADDPMLRGLHEMLDAENPGYLNGADPEAAERFMHNKKKPEHVHASAGDMRCTNCGNPVSYSGQGRRGVGEAWCPACGKSQELGYDMPVENQHVQWKMPDILEKALPAARDFGPVHQGKTHEAIMPPMQQGNLQAQQQALDPTGLNPSQQPQPGAPSSQTPPGGGAQQGHCATCGGVTQADGSCPQCGTAAAPSAQPLPGGPSQAPHPQTFAAFGDPVVNGIQKLPVPGAPAVAPAAPQGIAPSGGICPNCQTALNPDGGCPLCGFNNPGWHPKSPAQGLREMTELQGTQGAGKESLAHIDILASFIDSANHQGPVTPEQIAAVQQYLIQEGRVDEVPNVPLDPGNPEYAKILAEVQHNPMNPPPVTPEEQTQPPAPQPAAPGGMPVPGMAPGETGGQPMQPMSSFLPEFTAADNVAPRCPKCGSGTTGLVGDQDHNARCHSCQNVWKLGDLVSDENYGQTSIARTALRDERQHGGDEQANPIGVPAAEQEGQTNQGGDEDSSLTWKDSAGAPLKAGQQYQMVNPSFALPDLVRVERVKPDGVDLTLLGTYANDPSQYDPNTLTSSTPLSRQDMEMQHISFEPVGQNADEQNNEPPPGSAAPGHAQVPPSGQTTDEQAASEPQMAAQSSVDPDCPRCGHHEFTSSMITPEATEHSCFRCGHDWVTEEKGLEREAGIDLEWLKEDDDADDLSPHRTEMTRAAVQSKSIGDIAEKDERLRAVRDHLEHEKEARTERLAGKHFTPREQRELIDEDGVARNSDMLDLAGTHYKVRDDYKSKTNPERVRDADLFLGV